ncbi:GNAT family N-acetyltransferase [Parvularcula sp. LCG005]|uniref:GNAT family N-acetyltransferase n=1 Tax=Parvularcula sp. LCG005 TaxID=3078805 RepID=UPI002942E69B|nr:GNAT family N-acetyltransferase [Parvularcula sp. LCG005]WOI53005.1 GNAT family N-acetyltransferase [Parvularcula sp. LCG005]
MAAPLMPHSITTARLLLRPVTLRDAPGYWRTFHHPDVVRMTGSWVYPFSVEEVRRRFSAAARSADGHWYMVLEGGEAAGSVKFFNATPDGAELGYSICPSRTGRGLASEAARAFCAMGFRQFRYKTIRAGAFADNPASIHILEKLGFRPIADAEPVWSRDRRAFAMLMPFAMTREDYRP